MNRKKFTFAIAATLSLLLVSCNLHSNKLNEIGDYFYEAPTYRNIEFDKAQDYFAKNNDNWGGGCSAISKVINGKRIVGRNMDLNIARKCAYVVKTNVPHKYSTVGLSYTFRDVSPDLSEVKKSGLPETWSTILPFMCDDVLNSQGLHVELNMRHGETDEAGNDIFGVEHTNPNASERVYVFGLGLYLGLNCKNLTDVKEYLASNIDVYSKKNYWNYCFLITDAEGNSELLEFGNGKYYFVKPNSEGVVAQTNFYVNEECNSMEKVKSGLGRYESLMNGIKDVNSKSDMFNLMKKIQYSSFYLPYEECKNNHFDPRSELIGEYAPKEALTALYKSIMGAETPVPENIGTSEEFVMNDANEPFIKALCDYLHEPIRSMTREEKEQLNYDDGGANALWESTFTEVVDPKDKTIQVRLFENDNSLYQIDFKGVKSISEIK